jgi:hypothetical protein
MKISPQASLLGGVKVSDGDSVPDQEQGEKEIIVTDLGTNFTVDFREIELTVEQRKAISSDIISAIVTRAKERSSPADSMDPNIESADSMDPNIVSIEGSCWQYRYGQYI